MVHSQARALFLTRPAPRASPLARYNAALSRFPLLTKGITSALGMSLGDFIAQLLRAQKTGERFKLNVGRITRTAAFGGIVNGPLCHFWYTALEVTVLPGKPSHPVAILTKCLVDQIVFSPIGTALYFCCMKSMEGKPQETWKEVRTKVVPTTLEAYKLWPVAHIINFTFVPTNLRVLYLSSISVAWAVVLCACSQPSAIVNPKALAMEMS